MSSFLEVPADILKHFWVQVAVSLLKLPYGGFRIEIAARRLQIYNSYM
jgi:hypothetical protein